MINLKDVLSVLLIASRLCWADACTQQQVSKWRQMRQPALSTQAQAPFTSLSWTQWCGDPTHEHHGLCAMDTQTKVTLQCVHKHASNFGLGRVVWRSCAMLMQAYCAARPLGTGRLSNAQQLLMYGPKKL